MPEGFKTEDVLSVYVDKLLPGSSYEGIMQLLEFMYGGVFSQKDMSYIIHKCGVSLAKQHPWVKEIKVPENYSDTPAHLWMEDIVKKYGETHSVEPLKKGEIIS
ncbi:MAG: hypothetical protein ACOX0X_02175 [Candidatus Dojkabacteria bacterium]